MKVSLVVLVFGLGSVITLGVGTVRSQEAARKPDIAEKPAGNNEADKSLYPRLPESIANAELSIGSGQISKLSEHKGKVVLFNVTAMWCAPCRELNVALQKLLDKYSDSLEVISLSVGNSYNEEPEPSSDIKRFIRDFGIRYPIGHISGDSFRQVYTLTHQTAIPQTLVIDRDGRLRGVFLGGGSKMERSISKAVADVLVE